MYTKLVSSALFLSLSLIFTQQVYALHKKLKPEKCPSVSSIQSVGVNSAEGSGGMWDAFQKKANYDTTDEWSFFIGVFSASDADDALNQARNSLTTLTFTDGPHQLPVPGGWICMYQDNATHLAVAGTPPMSVNAVKHALRLPS